MNEHKKNEKTLIPDLLMDKWQHIVDLLANVLAVPSAIITRVDPPEIEVLRSARLSDNPYKSGDRVFMAKHYCEAVVSNNQKLQVTFAPKDPTWHTAPEIDYGMVAYLGYPLCWPNGEMFGTICTIDNKKNKFGSRYETMLEQFKEVIETHLMLMEKNEALKKALNEIKILRGLLPICSFCKKIRDDEGYWNQIEEFMHKHSDLRFSHGICQECAKKHYPDLEIYDD
jgi:transcriptional regulator with GAF, ATPase, and Fis domain